MVTLKRADTMFLYPVDSRSDYKANLTIPVQGEIDLRSEFENTIYGSLNEVAKGLPLVIRRLRRDPITLARTPCPCTDNLTGEPDRDTVCVYCLGEGYFWDEEIWQGYKVTAGSETSLARRTYHGEAGRIIDDTYRFYFPYNANIIKGDKIIELILDVEGNIARPMRRLVNWDPNSIEEKRLDNGRIEFFIVSCSQSNAIYIEKAALSFIENP